MGKQGDSKIARYGRDHPIIASEYYNQPIQGHGSLFDPRRLALMRGDHLRRRGPDPDLNSTPADDGHPITRSPAHPHILATLDLAGQDESASDPLAQLANPGRDYTVATVFQVHEEDNALHYHALDVFVDHGSRHFEDIPGRPRLADRLLAWLQHWQVAHLIADQSGVGAGLVSWLKSKLGPTRVSGYTFTPANKARLGSLFLSCIETGRFKYWTGEDQPLQDGRGSTARPRPAPTTSPPTTP